MRNLRCSFRVGRSGNIRILVLALVAAWPLALPAGETTPPGGAAKPDPSLTPEQVVRFQLEALRNNDESDRGIAVAFRFASPENKESTGPLPRFAAMIKSGIYRLMLTYRDAEYQPVEVAGDAARQRVTLVSPTYAVTFLFHLSRQRHPACNGCWMTDAVTVERVDSRAA